MSTFNFHHEGPGDHVNMVNTSHSQGIVKLGGARAADQAIEELRRQLQELRAHLAPGDVRTVDDNLPVVADPARTSEERRAALVALSGVVAALGAAAPSVRDLIEGVRNLIEGVWGLLGG
ncbi:hypothetical protein [Streptomyces sp. NPDC003247]|uniref:hypothetical protein n=1 Tax=Streptomyces sp. NPDC003247 TaxID=3364677 RepID=UPI00369A67DF